ncbi:MAG: hypothetical protein PHD67_07485 [Oscillospiraceae bacterium]|nr:hypothetical protein [Oscillospiraceae bacterium]
MAEEVKTAVFFLGAQTPQGFISLFQRAAPRQGGWEQFILKGGPGTGKSTALQRLLTRLLQQGFVTQEIRCAGDPGQLDALVLPREKILVADGTPPHVMEPELPGVLGRVFCMDEGLDAGLLRRRREEIVQLAEEKALCRERCGRFLTAAGSLIHDVSAVAAECIAEEKLERFAQRFAREHFLRERRPGAGEEQMRFLSAVTPEGITGWWGAVKNLCPTVWVLEDAYGAVSRRLLGRLRELALEYAEPVVSCCCPLMPGEKMDHLLFPRIGLALLTSGRFHPLVMERARGLHAERFLEMGPLRMRQKKLGFHVKAARRLIEEAGRQQALALRFHQEIESFYAMAADRSAADRQTGQLAAEVEELALYRREKALRP